MKKLQNISADLFNEEEKISSQMDHVIGGCTSTGSGQVYGGNGELLVGWGSDSQGCIDKGFEWTYYAVYA